MTKKAFIAILCTGNAIVAAVYSLLACIENKPSLFLGALIPLALCGVLLYILKRAK